MRSWMRTLGLLLALDIAAGALPAESRAAQVMLGCPATVRAGQQLTVEA
jgi:hypothetical protein